MLESGKKKSTTDAIMEGNSRLIAYNVFSSPPVAVYSRLGWGVGWRAKSLPETLTCLMADLRETSGSSWRRANRRGEEVCVSVLHSHLNRYSPISLISQVSCPSLSPSSLSAPPSPFPLTFPSRTQAARHPASPFWRFRSHWPQCQLALPRWQLYEPRRTVRPNLDSVKRF